MATQTIENRGTLIGDGERVRRWRIEQQRRAGYPGRAEQTLGARCDVDLHLATELLARGCSAALGLRILL
jgi:hypothetical protein